MTPSSTKLPITAIVLTNRSDSRLTQCLNSLTWAQEIVIIDDATGTDWSTWETGFGLDVVRLEQPLTDFAQARNDALVQASQPWVFFIDSDEVVTKESVSEIQRVIETDADGVLVNRSDIFYGQKLKWGEVRNFKLLRLGKKSQFRFERPIHEVGVVNGKVVSSSIEIEHFSHLNVSDFMKSVANHAQREAEYRRQLGQDFSLFELIVYPLVKTFQNLVLRLGVLDGWRGIIYVAMMSLHSLLVRVYLYEATVAQPKN